MNSNAFSFHWIRRTVAVAAVLLAASCGRPLAPTASETASTDISNAIARYLEGTIAPNYGGEGEHCIPLIRIVATDETNPADIRAWGDFQVWNYHLDSETLHCVSGGSHPGLMHLREADGALDVFSFDPVLDGSDYLPSAKRIFGRHFDAWQALSRDDAAHEEARRRGVAEYVSVHSLPVKFFQDYGWDPVPLSPVTDP